MCVRTRVHQQSHLCLGAHSLLLQRQGELVRLVRILLTLHLPGGHQFLHSGPKPGTTSKNETFFFLLRPSPPELAVTSVMGKACCWVSSLTLTTKSTSEVRSRQPACSWPDPLTMITSRAMWSSGRPRDCSIFLQFQRATMEMFKLDPEKCQCCNVVLCQPFHTGSYYTMTPFTCCALVKVQKPVLKPDPSTGSTLVL